MQKIMNIEIEKTRLKNQISIVEQDILILKYELKMKRDLLKLIKKSLSYAKSNPKEYIAEMTMFKSFAKSLND